jgi:hypothetical protein
MKIKNISITKAEETYDSVTTNCYYKKYEVEYKGKSDIIYYTDANGFPCFEPYYGNFSEQEFDEVKRALFDDAYYNRNFSAF